jgi:hypothetical protein
MTPQLPPRPKSAVVRQWITVALMLGALAYGLIAVGCPR